MLNSIKFWLINNLYSDIRQTIPVREIQPSIRVRCITDAPDWDTYLKNFG